MANGETSEGVVRGVVTWIPAVGAAAILVISCESVEASLQPSIAMTVAADAALLGGGEDDIARIYFVPSSGTPSSQSEHLFLCQRLTQGGSSWCGICQIDYSAISELRGRARRNKKRVKSHLAAHTASSCDWVSFRPIADARGKENQQL
jgi:hypothetical protein